MMSNKSSVTLFVKKRWDYIVLMFFFLFANCFVAFFVFQEKYLYFWDMVGYWSKTVYFSKLVLEDPFGALKKLILSIRSDDYNFLPSLILMPFSLIFSTSRSAYLLAIVNVFVMPSVIASIFLHKKFSSLYGDRTESLALAGLICMLILPNVWHPVLIGLPDAGGMVLIYVICTLYLRAPFKDQKNHVLFAMALLLAIMILFRRWYAYWVVSFYLACFTVETIQLLHEGNDRAKDFFQLTARLMFQAIVTGAVLFCAAPILVKRTFEINEGQIYSAFKFSNNLFGSFKVIVNNFGLLYFALFLIGAIMALANSRSRKFSFLLLWQAVIMFFLFARTQDFGPQHYYLLIPTIILFSTLGVTLIRSDNKFGRWVALILLIFGVFNFSFGFSEEKPWPPRFIKSFLTDIHYTPRMRADIEEIDHLLTVLDHVASSPGDRIYVLAASSTLNCHILNFAYLNLGRHERVGQKILWTHDVDKRDGFPKQLLTANYVVVADPIQNGLRNEDQQIVRIPAEFFLKSENIGASFDRLPYRFFLEGDVSVYIYKKVRPIEDKDLKALLQIYQKLYPDHSQSYDFENVAIH